MTQAIPKPAVSKPPKPYPGFPLFAHATRRWAKKIRGKLHYFGPWEDPQGALEKYLAQRDDLHAGRTPRVTGAGLDIRGLANRFLSSKKILLDTGEVSPRTWRSYYITCERLIRVFGRNRLVVDLASDDFELLRVEMSKTMGPVFLKVEIGRVRSIFKYAYDAGLVDRPVRHGPTFRAPSQRVLQRARRENGSRMFEADEIRRMLNVASVSAKAMILLGCNAAYGNHDIATLTFSALDLKGAWVNHARPKSGVERRCPLWAETIVALQDVIASRTTPRDKAHKELVFVTARGNPWIHMTEKGAWTDNIGGMMRELRLKAHLKRPGVGFYGFRHVFETIAGESIDQVAVDFLMGHHRANDMSAVYRERISDERLRAVAEHVRKWLFGE